MEWKKKKESRALVWPCPRLFCFGWCCCCCCSFLFLFPTISKKVCVVGFPFHRRRFHGASIISNRGNTNRIQKRISHGNSFLFSSFSGSCFFLLLLAWKKFLNKRFRRGPLLHLQNSRDSGKGLLNLLLPNCLPLILFVYWIVGRSLYRIITIWIWRYNVNSQLVYTIYVSGV